MCDFDAGISVSVLSGMVIVQAVVTDFSHDTAEIFIDQPISIQNDSILLLIEDIGYYTIFMIRQAYRIDMDWDSCLQIIDLTFTRNLCFIINFCSQVENDLATVTAAVQLTIFHSENQVFQAQLNAFCYPIDAQLIEVLRLTPLRYQLEIDGTFAGQKVHLRRERFTQEILSSNDFQALRVLEFQSYCILLIQFDPGAVAAYNAFAEQMLYLLLENQSVAALTVLKSVAPQMVLRLDISKNQEHSQRFLVKVVAYDVAAIHISISSSVLPYHSCYCSNSRLHVFADHGELEIGDFSCSPALNQDVKRAEIYFDGRRVAIAKMNFQQTGRFEIWLDDQQSRTKLNDYESLLLLLSTDDNPQYEQLFISDIVVSGRSRVHTLINAFCATVNGVGLIGCFALLLWMWRRERFDFICVK